MSTLIRSRWAAIGAAVAVTLGAGGFGIVNAAIGSGERSVFVPITPCRVLDTRASEAVPGRQTPLGPGETFTQNAHGSNGKCTGIPTDATGLTMNVTALNATSNSFITIWPTGPALPLAASLNPAPNQPPTPNAVVTDISAVGQFNVYNLAGSVDLVIDITGYFADHNHDDRYYTKAQMDVAKAQDKWISIDPLAVSALSPAARGNSGGTNSGLVLPEPGPGSVPAFDLGFTVPPDHTPNTTMTVELLWHINQASCAIGLLPNNYVVSRAGSVPRGGVNFPITPSVAPGVANVTARTTATIPVEGFGLAPGDAVILGVFRANSGDTCTASARITGIVVRYT